MPIFNIQTPDGSIMKVEAPEGASEQQILNFAQSQYKPTTSSFGQKAIGVGETALTYGTGALGQLVGNVAGVGREVLTGDFGKGTAEKTAQRVQQALTYQPRGEVAPEYLQNIQNVVEASKIAPTPVTGPVNIGFRAKAKVPLASDIKAQASQLYKQIDDAGVVIKSDPYNEFVNNVKSTVGTKVREARNPKIVDVFKELDEARDAPITLQKMQDLRESISKLKMASEKSDREFSGQIVEQLDDFVEKLDSTKLVAPAKGDVEAIKLVPQARNLWKQARKSELLDEVYRKAGIKATDPYDDVAVSTKLRSAFKDLAVNKDKLRGFTKEEVQAIEQAAKGGRIENALRSFGQGVGNDRFSVAGGMAGGGLSTFAFGPEFGNLVAGPIGYAIGAKTVPALKGVSRRAAGTLGKQNLQNVIDLVKTGGQPYSGVQLAPFLKANPIIGSTAPANVINAAGLLAPYMTNPEDYKSLL